MDKHISRRALLNGVVGTAVGLTVLGRMAEPAVADQPHMQAALQALQQALSQLQSAEADKAGHREKAIGFCQKAINQTQMGIRAGAK